MTLRSVYMITDMEGVAGVDDWDPRKREDAAMARGVYDRSEIQRLLTGEVNAAAEGLFTADVEEVIINDGHGAGRTILVEELISGVKIARGTMRPRSIPGFGPSAQALVQVGMHAMAGTPNACLAHTMTREGTVYRVNGREIGEMQFAAYQCGQFGVPWIYTSGDLHACRESEQWVPGIVTAAVKEGLSEQCAIHLAPVDARALIRETIQEAVAKFSQIAPLVADTPVALEIQQPEPWPEERVGAVRVDECTLRWTGPDMWSVAQLAQRGVENAPPPR
ncbi:MAG: M55 family metallopeptidase [Candidatus Latescibacterota bacterium]|nr:M55 family metallopeptidase [Candidatus Latescibacterota bacterium]